MLAQEPRDLAAFRKPLRALVAGRTVRGERPGGVARVAQHGLGAQSRDAEPSRNDSPDQENPSETGQLPISRKRGPGVPPDQPQLTFTAFSAEWEQFCGA